MNVPNFTQTISNHNYVNNLITCLYTALWSSSMHWSLSVLITYQITGINGKVKISGPFMIMQFNFRHFKILQLEKLALFSLANFCQPPIKPKFPLRLNYPI